MYGNSTWIHAVWRNSKQDNWQACGVKNKKPSLTTPDFHVSLLEDNHDHKYGILL